MIEYSCHVTVVYIFYMCGLLFCSGRYTCHTDREYFGVIKGKGIFIKGNSGLVVECWSRNGKGLGFNPAQTTGVFLAKK